MIAPQTLAEEFCQAIAFIHSKGWAPGTGGNFSCVQQSQPLTLLMAPSGVDKGTLSTQDLITVNEQGDVIQGMGQASAETLIHTAIASTLIAVNRNIGAVFHSHSVFNTLLSEQNAPQGKLTLSGYEMLKGLDGIKTHDTGVELPILPNSQDMVGLSTKVTALLRSHPSIYGFLLSGHGLYTWGASIFAAKRHLEILEFLLEVTYRKILLNPLQSDLV